MSDEISWAIAILPAHVRLLSDLAPNQDWMNHPLFQQWADWKTRQRLTDEEYLKLENYLKRCLDRAITLKVEAQQCQERK